MIVFEDGQSVAPPEDFLYRIDPIYNIEGIADAGFRCGAATRMVDHMNPANTIPETDWARDKGLRVPDAALRDAPRAFFFMALERARSWQQGYSRVLRKPNARWVLLRFSRQAPALADSSLFFVDGACGAVDRADYVVFPGAAVGETVVGINFIEIRLQNGAWMPLSDYVARRRANRAKREEKKNALNARASAPPPRPPQPPQRGLLRWLMNALSR